MSIDSFSKTPPTKEEIAKTIEYIALLDLLVKAMDKTRQDICQDCLDRRCEAGKVCKEFQRRVHSYAWEIVAKNAELN